MTGVQACRHAGMHDNLSGSILFSSSLSCSLHVCSHVHRAGAIHALPVLSGRCSTLTLHACEGPANGHAWPVAAHLGGQHLVQQLPLPCMPQDQGLLAATLQRG